MDENLKHLLKARLHASILAFAKAHKIELDSEVLKIDEWTTGDVLDVHLRIYTGTKPHESAVI